MQNVRSKNVLFPPPKYLLMSAVGIDISDTSIKYAKINNHGKGLHLGKYGEEIIPQGVIENGRIMSTSKLREILEKIRREHNLTFVRASLPEQQVYFFRMVVPDGSWETLRDTIELSLEDHVPIPVHDVVFDFDVVGRSGADAHVAVTAASQQMVESYSEVFSDAGLTLLSLELEASALARSVIHKDDMTAHLIVDFGEMRTGITIVSNGQVQFTSTISLGGKMLTEMLAKNFSISMEEAEKMKREYGLNRNTPHEDLFAILINNISVLRDEINRHFVYWHTHPDEGGVARPTIEKIVLVGGNSNLTGLPEYLSASLHVPAEIGNVWTNLVLPKNGIPELSFGESIGYTTAIGLAMHKAE